MTKSATFTEPTPSLLLPAFEDVAKTAGFQCLAGPASPVLRQPGEAQTSGGPRPRIDASELVITEAALLNPEELAEARAALLTDGIYDDENWGAPYLGQAFALGDGLSLQFDEDSLWRSAVKYGWAIEQSARIFRALAASVRCEVVFNAPSAVTPLEHLFIGRELIQRGVPEVDLLLTWPGRWEPAAEWIGEPEEFQRAIPMHSAIARTFGSWKMSFAHVEQKFSLLPWLAQHGGENLHLNLDGIAWVEAMRVFARQEPSLLRSLLPTAQDRFIFDKPLEEIATTEDDIRTLPDVPDSELERLFIEDFRGRQMLHVTAHSLLAEDGHGPAIRDALHRHASLHAELVDAQLRKHFEPWFAA